MKSELAGRPSGPSAPHTTSSPNPILSKGHTRHKHPLLHFLQMTWFSKMIYEEVYT